MTDTQSDDSRRLRKIDKRLKAMRRELSMITGGILIIGLLAGAMSVALTLGGIAWAAERKATDRAGLRALLLDGQKSSLEPRPSSVESRSE